MSTRTLARARSRRQLETVSSSPAAKLRPPKRMPPLCVGLFDRAGNLVQISEQRDPRELLADMWNASYSGWMERTARPLSEHEAKIARKLLAERTVAHV